VLIISAYHPFQLQVRVDGQRERVSTYK
jgi:hypothetical protein